MPIFRAVMRFLADFTPAIFEPWKGFDRQYLSPALGGAFVLMKFQEASPMKNEGDKARVSS